MTTTSGRSKKRSSTKPRGAGRRRSRGGNVWIWVFLGVLVVLFGVLAFVSRSTGPAAEITDATVSGDALPPMTPGEQAQDAAVGRQAAELSGTSIAGEPMTITPGDGTPKAIVFLAHWCPHCQREVPVVTDWVADGGQPEGVELVAVTTGIDRNRPNFPPSDWLEREEFPAATLVDGDNAAAQAYGLTNYPYWVLVNGEGVVVQRWSGETTPAQLTERIGQLAQ